jgi:cobalt-zinc-cadmium efflux system outer membrane protein
LRLFSRLALIIVFAATCARAQHPPTLTLQSALDLADKQNLDLAAARRRRAVALAGIQIARQRPNPTLSFEALRDSPHQALLFEQPLELGFKRGRRIDVAREEGVLTDVEIGALARQVRRATRVAFYGALLARAESERLARVVQLAERLEKIARDRFEAGDVAQLEVIQAGLEASRARADHQVAEQREKVSLSQLNALLNEPADTSWELAGKLEDAGSIPSLSELIERARQLNPELQRLGQEQKIEESRRALLKAERLPNLAVQVGSDFNAPPDFRAGPRGALAMELPLFSRNQGQITQSQATQQVLSAEAAAMERAVSARLEAGYFDIEAQKTQVELYSGKLLPTARQVEGLAEESYRTGKTSILSVLQAQQNVQEVERSYLESLFALQSMLADLEEAVGGPID